MRFTLFLYKCERVIRKRGCNLKKSTEHSVAKIHFFYSFNLIYIFNNLIKITRKFLD